MDDSEKHGEGHCDWCDHFDWDEVCLNLDGAESVAGRDYPAMASALGELLRWIVNENTLSGCHSGKERLQAIGRRTVALAWVTNPEIFKLKSGAQLARAFQLKRLSRSSAAAEARRTFGVCNQAQKHAWNFAEKTK